MAPKLKLPKPPVPPGLKPPPARPGTEEPMGPLDQAKEAGISAVDWIDERTSLSGGARWIASTPGSATARSRSARGSR